MDTKIYTNLLMHYVFYDSAKSPPATTSVVIDLSKALVHRCKNRPPEKQTSSVEINHSFHK